MHLQEMERNDETINESTSGSTSDNDDFMMSTDDMSMGCLPPIPTLCSTDITFAQFTPPTTPALGGQFYFPPPSFPATTTTTPFQEALPIQPALNPWGPFTTTSSEGGFTMGAGAKPYNGGMGWQT